MKKSEAIKQFDYISDYAKDLLDTIPEEFEVDKKREFKFVTLKELGFSKDWIRTEEFLNNEFLAKHGLSLCNPEDVFEIAKNIDEYVNVGMQPIPDRDGGPDVFNLTSDSDELELYASNAKLSGKWFGYSRWVFLASSTKFSDTQNLHSDTLSLEQAIKICKDAGLTVTKIY